MATIQTSTLSSPAGQRFMDGIRALVQTLVEKEAETILADAQTKLDKAIKKIVSDTAIDFSRWVDIQYLSDRLVITIRDERKSDGK